MVDVVCRNIDLNKPKHIEDVAIVVLQSLEVRICIYLPIYRTIFSVRLLVIPICNVH